MTKTFPASDVRLLAGLGVRDIGENRDVEGAAKAAETGDLGLTLALPSVGCRPTRRAPWPAAADLVHSVDRPSLVAALARGRGQPGAGWTAWSR